MRNFNSSKGVGCIIHFIIGIFLLMSISGGITAQEYISLPDSLDCFTPKSTLKEIFLFVEQAEDRNDACVKEALSILKQVETAIAEKDPTARIQDSNIWGLTLESFFTLHPQLVAGSSEIVTRDSLAFSQQNTNRVGTKKVNPSGSRSGKGSGGTNSIRVDDVVDAPYNSYTTTQLVQDVLVTGCLTASNITFSGNENLQIGYFNKGDASFPLAQGIVLSTGSVTDAQGPNTATNVTTEMNTAGDSQLQSIATGTVRDAAVLEFDFVPAGDTVTFNYIFASEEYPEYACSDYNDVFGFFVTSVDNDGIGYDNENVAVLPNNQGVVSINNVHGAGRDDGNLSYGDPVSIAFQNGCDVGSNTVGGYYLQEGFESGNIPDGWSQIENSGNVSWQVLGSGNSNNLLNPHSGAYNASFYGSSAATMLVTPEIDLDSNLDNYLSFWHAQPRQNGENGTLQIYYKNSSGGTWTEIETFDDRQDSWVKDILLLPNSSSTYQIGFIAENTDDEENGIVLDDVYVYYTFEEPYSDYLPFNTNCDGSNTQYYFDQSAYVYEYGDDDCIQTVRGGVENAEIPFDNIEADGRTVKLTATFVAVPCSTYHIKLAVGDVRDRKWDSWVFLEANSFQSNDILLTASSNGVVGADAIFEGCISSTNYITVSRANADASQELVVDVDYTPAGVNGGQILQLDGTLLPETIIIPAGVMSQTIEFYAIDDGIPEDPINNGITMTFYTGCPCDPEPTSIDLGFQIYDVLDLTSMEITANNVLCNGESNGVIIANPIGGSGAFEYMLSGTESRPWQSSNTFNGLPPGTYSVTVRDEQYLLDCNDPITVGNVVISQPEPIIANAGLDKTLCFGQTTAINGSGGVNFAWSPTDWLSDPNASTPTVTPSGVTNIPITKEYTLTVTDGNGNCPQTDNVSVTVNPTPDVSIYVDGVATTSINVCPDANTTLQATVTPQTTTSPLNYLWSDNSTTSAITVSPNSSQPYSVNVTNDYGCSKNKTIQVLVYPFEVAASIDQNPVCPEEVDGVVTISVDGHSGNLPVTVDVTGPSGYSEQLTFTAENSDPQIITNLGIGNYSVTGTSSAAAACTSTDIFTLAATDVVAPDISYAAAGDTIAYAIISSGNSGSVSVPSPQVTDECNFSFVNDFNNSTSAEDTYPLGKTVVQWTASDGSGNASVLTQNVYVASEADFTISCPDPTVMDLGYNPQLDDFIEELSSVVTTSGSSWWKLMDVTSVLGAEVSDGSTCGYMRTRTYTAEWCLWGISGFACVTKTCEREYHYIVDLNPPAITCPASISSSPSVGQTSMSISVGNATATDNCTEDANITIVGSRSDALNIDDLYPLGLTTITWTATDGAGNQSLCEQEVNIVSSCAPGGVSLGLELWLRSNSGVYHNGAVAGNGDWVSLWDDQIKNRDAIAAADNFAPAFSDVASQLINYNPVLVFDGSNDYLTSPLNASEMESTLSVFIVAIPLNEGAVMGIGADAAIWFLNNGAVKASFSNGTKSTTTTSNSFPLSEVNILSIVKTGDQNGDLSIFKNGIELNCPQTSCSSVQFAENLRIGVDLASTITNAFEGHIAEIIVFNRDVSLIEKQRIESYLAIKFGITLGD